MKEYEYNLDYWLEKIEGKDLIYFIYSKFLLQQIPLDIQEDEGLFAQVIGYGRDVFLSIVQSKRPEIQCSRVIREAKARVWKWDMEVLGRIYDWQQEEYESILSECALCVAWGILYNEGREASLVVTFLNQMLQVWRSQWMCYQEMFTTKQKPGKTRLEIMYDLMKQYDENKRKEEERKKNEEAQKKANEGLAKMGRIPTPDRMGNEINNFEQQIKKFEFLRKENEDLKTKIAELKRTIDELQRKQKELTPPISQNQDPLSLKIAKNKEVSVLVTLDGMHKAKWIEGATRDDAVKEISKRLFGKEIATPAQKLSRAREAAGKDKYKQAIQEAKEEMENVLEDIENLELYLLNK